MHSDKQMVGWWTEIDNMAGVEGFVMTESVFQLSSGLYQDPSMLCLNKSPSDIPLGILETSSELK